MFVLLKFSGTEFGHDLTYIIEDALNKKGSPSSVLPSAVVSNRYFYPIENM